MTVYDHGRGTVTPQAGHHGGLRPRARAGVDVPGTAASAIWTRRASRCHCIMSWEKDSRAMPASGRRGQHGCSVIAGHPEVPPAPADPEGCPREPRGVLRPASRAWPRWPREPSRSRTHTRSRAGGQQPGPAPRNEDPSPVRGRACVTRDRTACWKRRDKCEGPSWKVAGRRVPGPPPAAPGLPGALALPDSAP